MNFFTNLFGDKKKDKKNDKKHNEKLPHLNAKTTEEQRLAHDVARLFASIEMPALSIPQLADFFDFFNSIVSGCESLQIKWNSVRKTRDICAKLIQPNASIRTIALEGFHPSYEIEMFLEGILAEPLPLRARHTLALHRFCTVLSHQFEEENMTSSNAINIDAPQAIDLKRIYLRLLEGTTYLPTAEEFHEIVKRTTELLRQERNIVMVSLPAVVVGDIHGQIRDLLYHVIANGGPLVHDSITTCTAAVTGCDDAPEASRFGGMDFSLREHPIWTAANESFKCLPLAAAVFKEVHEPPPLPPAKKPGGYGGQGPPLSGSGSAPRKKQIVVVAMHGGISPFIENSIDGILAINRFKEISTGALADLTWSDPLPNGAPAGKSGPAEVVAQSSLTSVPDVPQGKDPTTEEIRKMDFSKPATYTGPPVGYIFSARGTGHNFGEDATCKFINSNRLYFIVRAHQCVQEGYKWCHQNRVLTVFSAPNYCGLGNKGSILLLDKDGKPTTLQYQLSEDVKTRAPVPRPPQNFR
eukprot:gene5135-3686_t